MTRPLDDLARAAEVAIGEHFWRRGVVGWVCSCSQPCDDTRSSKTRAQWMRKHVAEAVVAAQVEALRLVVERKFTAYAEIPRQQARLVSEWREAT